MNISPLAGRPADLLPPVNIPRLITDYYVCKPDPAIEEQRVSFGTSGHRGSSFETGFNENHILAITQAICLYRQSRNINGPLFLGMDTHALSFPALATAMEVLAVNQVETMLSEGGEYTPTPVISHAILKYNRGRKTGLADGIVITPSHNPPDQGGFKYNLPNGGPASLEVTSWIEKKANEFLAAGLRDIRRVSYATSLKASTTRYHDYLRSYVEDLINVIDMDPIRESKISLGVDPLGGAGVHYWKRIAEHYGLNLTVVSEGVDPTFRFMTLDWDGKIRMDPSSSYAMHSLIGMKSRFRTAFACDTDHDRHGIVTPSEGLMQPNHYLSVMIDYLFKNRPLWNSGAAVGKTVVSSRMIDRVAAGLDRRVYEVPVGFKWYVDGLFDGSLAFAGEESAGASFVRKDGSAWSTDKDGIIPSLLAGEMTARTGRDPSEIYLELTQKYGISYYDRIEAAADLEQKKILAGLSPSQVHSTELAGEKIVSVQTTAEGNGASLGGLKVIAKNGWFVARPSGTEKIYKIYGESFISNEHLQLILNEAQSIVLSALTTVNPELSCNLPR